MTRGTGTWPSWQLVGAILGIDILASIFALFGWLSGPAPHNGSVYIPNCPSTYVLMGMQTYRHCYCRQSVGLLVWRYRHYSTCLLFAQQDLGALLALFKGQCQLSDVVQFLDRLGKTMVCVR